VESFFGWNRTIGTSYSLCRNFGCYGDLYCHFVESEVTFAEEDRLSVEGLQVIDENGKNKIDCNINICCDDPLE